LIDITNLKSNVDLVSVLTQRGLEFKPQGSSLFARCPFHPDDTPSLSVNPKEQLWSCFGCGAGGDVFTFVQKQEGIGFVDAVKKLLKHDIQEKDLEDLNREREKTETKQVDRPHQEILDRVLVYWQKSLSRSRKAQEYLKSRGLWSPTILRPLKVGFSTGRLTDTLPQSGKLTRQLKQMGILNKKGNEFF